MVRAIRSMLLATLLLLTSCQNGPGPNNPDPCLTFHPIYLSPGDVLTPDTARQVLEHDRAGAALCGWKPAR